MTELRKCPCCKRILPPEPTPFDNAPVKRRIYTFIARHPEGVTCRQVMDHVYELDANGGPESDNIIRVHIHHMRKRLANMGVKIVSSNFGCGGATYRLAPRPNVNTSKPVLKTCDRQGVGGLASSDA